MGNVFKGSWALGTALLLCSACGSGQEASSSRNGLEADEESTVPEFDESLLPQAPAAPPAADPSLTEGSEKPATQPTTQPNTPINEAPPAGNGTPLAPPTEMNGGTTPTPVAPPPTEETPPEEAEPPASTPSTQVFILFGQSNMWGVPNPQQQDLEINPRVEVLTLAACERHPANQWMPAQPPLHDCVGRAGTDADGPGVGPGDYFGKALAAAFPEDTILLVPNAIPGVSIDVFQPGQQAYNSMLSRARMAQERGEIRGIIFHQGETDNGQDTWPGRVETVVDRLRSDLGIGEVPFVAGELLVNGCCGGHNRFVNQLAVDISNAFVARANGFAALPNDGFGNLHFDLASQREFGARYGAAMIDALRR